MSKRKDRQKKKYLAFIKKVDERARDKHNTRMEKKGEPEIAALNKAEQNRKYTAPVLNSKKKLKEAADELTEKLNKIDMMAESTGIHAKSR